MGRVLLVYRLAVRDLRRHAGQAALLLLVIAGQEIGYAERRQCHCSRSGLA